MLETCDSFDTYNIAQMARRYNPANIASVSLVTPGASGSGQALRLNDNGWGDASFWKCPLTQRTGYVLGFDLRCGLLPIGILTVNSAAGVIFPITVTGQGAISTPFGNSMDGLILLNTWQTFQAKCLISSTAGVLVLKIDGVVALNLTGLNTGTSPITSITIKPANGARANTDIDNFWVFNLLGTHSNDFPVGRMAVQRQTPTSDGTHADLTPSTGLDRYAMVSDVISDDDASYVSGITPGAVDTYRVSALPGAPAQIHGALITGIVRKDDINSKTLRIVGQSGAVLSEGADIDVPLTYTSISLLLAEDPSTSAQWTLANINNLQPGAKIIL